MNTSTTRSRSCVSRCVAIVLGLGLGLGLVRPTGSAHAAPAARFRTDHVWPLSGTSRPDGAMLDSFGPRLRSDAEDRYHCHRGIDATLTFASELEPVVDVDVDMPAADLDLARVEVVVSIDGEIIDRQNYDLEARNRTLPTADLDVPLFGGVHVAPAPGDAAQPRAPLHFTFSALHGPAASTTITVRAFDVTGSSTAVER